MKALSILVIFAALAFANAHLSWLFNPPSNYGGSQPNPFGFPQQNQATSHQQVNQRLNQIETQLQQLILQMQSSRPAAPAQPAAPSTAPAAPTTG